MIRVTIEKFPAGDRSRPELLGTIELLNVDHALPEISNYGVRRFNAEGRLERRGKVRNHKRAKGWVPLLHRALQTVL